MAPISAVVAGLSNIAASVFGDEMQRTLTKIGYFRQLTSSPLADPADLVVINDTVQCEDLHYFAPANTIFTACDDDYETRFKWFPPLGFFDDPALAWKTTGSIHTIDPATRESTRLALENFDGPFITHGIEVIADPAASDAVYIFAVNHVPNEAVYPRNGRKSRIDPNTIIKKADSRVDVFHHVLGSETAQYVRTVATPLIKTPNDIVAISPTELYVSNDHVHLDGPMRTIENTFPGSFLSDVIHVTLAEDGSIDAAVASAELLNPNGIRRGRTEDEIVISSAMGGYITLGKMMGGSGSGIVVDETIDFDSVIDNPTWYEDVYAGDEATGGTDASGFVIAGMARAINTVETAHDPEGKEGVLVWYATPSKDGSGGWDKRLLWQDDGNIIRNTATALLVGIDPAEEDGAKKAWLYVAGVSSDSTVAVKVDLS